MKDKYYINLDYFKFDQMLKERNISYTISHDWMHRFTIKNNLGMTIIILFYKCTENSGYFGSIKIKYKDFEVNIDGSSLDISFKDDQANFAINAYLDDYSNQSESTIFVGRLQTNN